MAISPDEKRIAVGDTAGKLTIYDLSGEAIGSAKSFDAPINALGWAQQRDWFAVGTVKGQIAMLDVAAQEKAPIQEGTFRDQSIAALAWSPRSSASLSHATALPCPAYGRLPARRMRRNRSSRRCGWRGTASLSHCCVPIPAALARSMSPNGSLRIWNLAQDSRVSCELYGDDMAESATLRCHPTAALSRGQHGRYSSNLGRKDLHLAQAGEALQQ